MLQRAAGALPFERREQEGKKSTQQRRRKAESKAVDGALELGSCGGQGLTDDIPRQRTPQVAVTFTFPSHRPPHFHVAMSCCIAA